MLNFIKTLFDSSKKVIKSVQPTIDQINALEKELESKSLDELKNRIKEMRKELKTMADDIPAKYKNSLKAPGKDSSYVKKEEAMKAKLLSFLPEVYGSVREVTKRSVDKRHYDVQLTASTILAQGYKLTELKTGEGKTLVFQMTAALYGLTGRGSHVVTVNDYLARRDGEYAGHILSQLGLTVGVITPQQAYKFAPSDEVGKHKGEEIGKQAMEQQVSNPGDCDGINLIDCSKKDAYACDIVYGTNNEFGFDYLRDNMTQRVEDIVQSELYFCIVDEADSILIDEARTPLIISAPAGKSNDLYAKFASIVPKLKVEDDYTVDEKSHSVTLTDEGSEKVERMLGVKNVWQDYKLAHHLENALKAEALYKKDIQYIVKNGQVFIVDQSTGRVLEGRRYSQGLHQAIEAKEGVEVKQESKTLGTITFQNFFRLYKILSGGSGTVMTEQEEFYKIYNLDSVEVPTNKPVIREDNNDRVYKDREAKFNAVVGEVTEINKIGNPILIGTASIDDSEFVSRKLENKGIAHEVLNAKYHERESKIVANAGKRGAITVATNMAGRGTDIKLGGKNSTKDQYQEIIDLGGLVILGTQRHESRRIDNQLRGRSGRQGEPGMSRFYVSLEDDIMRIQGGEFVQKIMEMTKLPDDMPLEAGLVGRSIESAQKKMEGMHFDSRKTVVEYDDVVNQQREIFYSRRRRILKEIERASEKIKNPSENKDEKNYLKDYIWERMKEEVEDIVRIHFVSEREDSIDKKKLIDDYLDLALDDNINSAIDESIDKEKRMQLGKGSAKDRLNELFKDKNQDEIKDYLLKIIKTAFDKKIKEFGPDLPNVSRVLILRSMDDLWTEHLSEMRALRDGIGLRGYAQQDPLVEYKNEGFEYFDKFIRAIDSQVARRVLKLAKVQNVQVQRQEKMQTNEEEVKDITTGTHEIQDAVAKIIKPKVRKSLIPNRPPRTEPQKQVVKSVNIGRNDLCPCGSGLKYKKCGLINSPKHKA